MATSATYASKKIGDEHIEYLKGLRRAHAEFARTSDASKPEDAVDGIVMQFHYPGLDGAFDIPSQAEDIKRESHRLQHMFGSLWTAELEQMVKVLGDMVPAWSAKRETLLSENDVCEALLANVANYGRIGPVAAELKDWQKQLKLLHADGHGSIVEPSLVKRLGTDANHGIETVAFTFVVHYIREEFRKLDAADVKKSVAELRQEIVTKHRVPLTTQMDEWLQEFADGKRTGEEHLARDAAVVVAAFVRPSAPAPSGALSGAARAAAAVPVASSKRRKLGGGDLFA